MVVPFAGGGVLVDDKDFGLTICLGEVGATCWGGDEHLGQGREWGVGARVGVRLGAKG